MEPDFVTATAELLKLLNAAGSSSSFCIHGRLAPILPGLKVEGAGEIGIPVSPADADRLIRVAQLAPYGRGKETILDTSVRNVWQLEPRQFTLRNPAWDALVAKTVEGVRAEFAIQKKVEHHLYKLLIYEAGSFFAPHRDSEKLPGMFATLIICLPAEHEGGVLTVTNAGQTRRIEFGGRGSAFETQYTSFYADCQHEVQPVTSGHRVCLVYNLTAEGRAQPSAPDYSREASKAAGLLSRIFADESRDKLAVELHHKYTQAALHPTDLKGADRVRMEILSRAAMQLDYQILLALMTHRQSGSVDPGSLDYRPSRRYFDDEEDFAGDGDVLDEGEDAEFEEVSEDSLSLDHWLDPDGHGVPYGEMKLLESEILSNCGPEDRAYEKEIREATGNEGVSMDRWYRRGAVVIWPHDRYFNILAREGPGQAVPALERLVSETGTPSADPVCLSFAELVIERWTKRESREAKMRHLSRMLRVLESLGSVELALRFVREVLPNECDGSEGPALAGVASSLGWPHFADALPSLFPAPDSAPARLTLLTPVTLFESLSCSPPKMTEDRRSVCLDLGGRVEKILDWFDDPRRQEWWAIREPRQGVVESLFKSFSMIGDFEKLENLVSRVISDPRRYDLHETVIPAVMVLARAGKALRHPAWRRLFDHALAGMRSRTAVKPEPPADWRRDAPSGCRCADCLELTAFLRNPAEQSHSFRRRKESRRHLESAISAGRCDLTCVTDTRSSPQILICTKNQASFERRLSQFQKDSRLILELESLVPHSS